MQPRSPDKRIQPGRGVQKYQRPPSNSRPPMQTHEESKPTRIGHHDPIEIEHDLTRARVDESVQVLANLPHCLEVQLTKKHGM